MKIGSLVLPLDPKGRVWVDPCAVRISHKMAGTLMGMASVPLEDEDQAVIIYEGTEYRLKMKTGDLRKLL